MWPRDGTEAQLEQIGGLSGEGVRKRALKVQEAIYSVAAGLRPPPLDKFPSAATEPMSHSMHLKGSRFPGVDEILEVIPLVILDDAHALHPDQREAIFRSLARREIRFGRWWMMRLDALSLDAILGTRRSQESHNLNCGRDFIEIRMQGLSDSRANDRNQFRTIALDMADRYLPHVQALKNRNAANFRALLPTEPPTIQKSNHIDLIKKVNREQLKLEVTDNRREKLANMAINYLSSASSNDRGKEVELAMTRILMHRYANRINEIAPLFLKYYDPEPAKPIKVNSQVARGSEASSPSSLLSADALWF